MTFFFFFFFFSFFLLYTDEDSVKAPTSSSKPDGLAGQVYSLIESIQNSLQWKESKTENTSDSTRPHHRGKRFISYERYLEMMVVADHKMVEHHGGGVQLYVLTLVAVVNRIFRDPSIGNAINVTLVELRILQNVNDGPHISSNAPMTLKNFCAWQQQQNQAEDSHPHHYDTAVLLTRYVLHLSIFIRTLFIEHVINREMLSNCSGYDPQDQQPMRPLAL
ncbi:A disintegrin and metalloproteinase with thrombospondin motifs 20-like [Strongylocentrotus purpuratus]|uniref:Peptidase M12B domain-containing protein n=1 Tax=Strongylocentrotus purpuratus TaxID=7668 RepID=A0A7M7PUB6_STRPU|nr:A disintegrin and metalloproteinase with thrombospondin motifs 20-like [Strongylocentrotus purpuratus]